MSVLRNRVAYAIDVFCVSKSFGGGFRNRVVYAIMGGSSLGGILRFRLFRAIALHMQSTFSVSLSLFGVVCIMVASAQCC